MEFSVELGGVALAVVGVVSALGSLAGSWAAQRVHMHYMRRDIEEVKRKTKAAHWRLDEIGAPPAPTVD